MPVRTKRAIGAVSPCGTSFGLAPGKHTVRLVVRGETYGDHKGTQNVH